MPQAPGRLRSLKLKIQNIMKKILHIFVDSSIRRLSGEHGLLLMVFAAFLVFPRLSRQIDVTSAPLDPGILSIVIMAVLSFLIFKALSWWLIRIIWPVFAEYSELHFERNFKSLLSWQKVLIYLGFYLCLLMGFVATLSALA